MEDHSQAISFANSYFSLVDGLAPGLENHLSETVVLDWFGRTIKGRKNVTEFMKAHKVGSRHVFKSIMPVPQMNYGKDSSKNSKKITRAKSFATNDLCDNSFDQQLKKELNFDRLSITENNNVLTKDCNAVSFDNKEGNNCSQEISVNYELDENDLANLFALESTPTRTEDIEESINAIKLKEEERILEKLHGVDNGDSIDPVKYIEAIGQIEFSKKTNKRGAELHTWKRQSQLQIAYSVIAGGFCDENRDELGICDDHEIEDQSMEWDHEITSYKIPRLPNLGEITEISNNLVPNINNFGGYFTSFDFTTERDNFLEILNAELSSKNSSKFLRTPQYVDDRLVFTADNIFNKKNCGAIHDDDNNNKDVKIPNDHRHQGNGFVFNYLIHLIIYQGNSKCRRSLTDEFDIKSKK